MCFYTSEIYVSGIVLNFPTEFSEDYDIMILKNPMITYVTEGSGGDGADDDDGNGNPPGIPSYDLLIIVCVICLCSALLIKRILKKF